MVEKKAVEGSTFVCQGVSTASEEISRAAISFASQMDQLTRLGRPASASQ